LDSVWLGPGSYVMKAIDSIKQGEVCVVDWRVWI